MPTVDDILASGRYTDRRGRQWGNEGFYGWRHHSPERILAITTSEMRAIIERDQHRDICPGLINCQSHPVAHACKWRWEGVWFACNARGRPGFVSGLSTHAEAMDAAMTIAKGA